MLKLIVPLILFAVNQETISTSVVEGLVNHGYAKAIQSERLDKVCDELVTLISHADETPSDRVVNAHLLHLLRRHVISDATYWLSIVRGKNVTAQHVLVDLLPKLNRRFLPHRIGLAHKRVAGHDWVVTLLVHRAGDLNVELLTSGTVAPLRVEGYVSRGYFQPKLVAALATGQIINVPVSLNERRRFVVSIDQQKVGVLKRLELLAEHMSGPRVINLLHFANASSMRSLPIIRMERPSTLSNDRSLFNRIAALRRESGRAPLVWSDALSAIAKAHADVIARRQSLTHKAPTDGHLRQRLSTANLFPKYMAELLVSAPSSLDALAAIRMSPAHDLQIQLNRFNRVGIGVKDDYYVVILAHFDLSTNEVD